MKFARTCCALAPWPVKLNLLDLIRAPYGVYGVEYIDLVSLDVALASQMKKSGSHLFLNTVQQNLDLRRILLSDPSTFGN